MTDKQYYHARLIQEELAQVRFSMQQIKKKGPPNFVGCNVNVDLDFENYQSKILKANGPS